MNETQPIRAIMKGFTILVLCASFVISINADDWWKHAVVYQVYPRSFKDSNGDGVGDLNGITSKLEHIKEAGADVVWLSPIFSSPQVDFGYDISNFTNIHHEYGTMADFTALMNKAKSLGLKVILDFVPNHSSPEHEWFKKSVQKIKPYDEYYIWNDGKVVNGTRQPPNNWLSTFSGSAWEWNPIRKQYYFHQFAVGQPDLNYRDANLRKEMENVLTFWLDRGVSGFRIDAINHMYEDVRLLDEPRSTNDVPADDYEYLNHIYTRDQKETYETMASWRSLFNNHSKSRGNEEYVILTEAYTNIPLTMQFYLAGSNAPMNFAFITNVNKYSSAIDMKKAIHVWLNNIPMGYTPNWVTGNHDNRRVASRFGFKREDQTTALAMILPGVAIVYNGDEIGMVDKWLSYEQTLDPPACNAGPSRYEPKSRDPERTPFQWDATTSAGFSTNKTTWLPVNENYLQLNLAAQKKAPVSHFKVFKDLTALRKSDVLKNGTLEVTLVTEKVLAVVRRLPGHSPIVLLINLSNWPVLVDAADWLNIPDMMRVYTSSVHSMIQKGTNVNTAMLQLPGAATVVLGDGAKMPTPPKPIKF